MGLLKSLGISPNTNDYFCYKHYFLSFKYFGGGGNPETYPQFKIEMHVLLNGQHTLTPAVTIFIKERGRGGDKISLIFFNNREKFV